MVFSILLDACACGCIFLVGELWVKLDKARVRTRTLCVRDQYSTSIGALVPSFHLLPLLKQPEMTKRRGMLSVER